jgi:hypothetical protein
VPRCLLDPLCLSASCTCLPVHVFGLLPACLVCIPAFIPIIGNTVH